MVVSIRHVEILRAQGLQEPVSFQNLLIEVWARRRVAQCWSFAGFGSHQTTVRRA